MIKTITIAILMLCVVCTHGQIDPSAGPAYVDPTDLAMIVFKKKRQEDTTNTAGLPQKGKLIMFIVPSIGSNPSLGTFFGVGGTAAIFLGDPATTSISNMNGSILFTTKDQFIASIKGVIMTPDNEWEMLADFKYSIYAENTYGLGTDFSQPVKEGWNWGGIPTAGIGGEQPLQYDQIKIYYTALKRVAKHFYIGLGYHLDDHYLIKDLSLDTTAVPAVITSHYGYNKLYGFNTDHYISSGVSLNVVYDSRDHTVNTYKGVFLQLAHHHNEEFLGSSKNSDHTYFEARLFQALSKTKPRHVISFWGLIHLTTSGEHPYLHLPANANDMRGRSSRGYTAGRFRGKHLVTMEGEYRFPLTRNGLLGGVLFGNMNTASRPAITLGEQSLPALDLFEANRYAGGFGLRLMIDRTGRLNLCADMAFGENGAKGFYLTAGETF